MAGPLSKENISATWNNLMSGMSQPQVRPMPVSPVDQGIFQKLDPAGFDRAQEGQLLARLNQQLAPDLGIPQQASMMSQNTVDVAPDMSQMTAARFPAQAQMAPQNPNPFNNPEPRQFGGSIAAKKNFKDDYQKKYKEYMDQREKLLQNTLERARLTNGGYTPEPDLTGLMSLADAWGDRGSNFTAAYQKQRPMNEQERMMLAQKLEGQAGQQLGGMMNEQYKQQMLGQQQEAMQARLTASLNKGSSAFDKEAQKTRQHFGQSKSKASMDDTLHVAKSLENYKNVLNKYKNSTTLTGPARAEVESAYRDFLVKYNSKEAELGALAGQDLNILQGITAPQFGISGVMSDILKGGKGTQINILNKLLGGLHGKMKERHQNIRDIYPEGSGVDDSIKTYEGRMKSFEKYSKGSSSLEAKRKLAKQLAGV